MEKRYRRLSLCMLFVFIPCLCFPTKVNADDDIIIVTSSSTKYTENTEKDYYNKTVSSISESKLEEEKDEKHTKEVELLNEELEINNLDNLIVNNSDTKLFIYESEDEESEKLGILMPNAVGEAEDLREFDSELDRFIAGDAEWLFIESSNISGFIKSENLLQGEKAVNKLNDLYNTKAKVTSNEKVYVRREKKQESDSITFLRRGAYVKVNTEELEFEVDDEGNELLPEWIPVIVDEEEGYIASDSITLVNSVDYAMKYVKPEPNSYSSGTRVVVPPTEETPSAVVDFAMQFIGNPYIFGGISLTNGCDCSGFVKSVYQYFGVELPHYSYSLQYVGIPVEYDEIRPGDICVYEGHCGIYAGNNKIVNALNKKNGITLTDVNYDTVIAVRRVLE